MSKNIILSIEKKIAFFSLLKGGEFPSPGRVLPIIGHGLTIAWGFRGDDPHFWDFQSNWELLGLIMPVLQTYFKAMVATWAPNNWNLVAHT